MAADLRLVLGRLWVPALVVALMAMLAASGYRAVFSSWGFMAFVVAGALGAALMSLLAAWRNLVLGEAVAASLAGFVVVGLGVGRGPGGLFSGLVNGWADLLSVSTPADLTAEFAVLPYTTAWLATLIGCELLRGRKVPALPATGPIIGLALTLLFTIERLDLALIQGAGLAAGTVVLGLVQHRSLATDSEEELTEGSIRRRSRRGMVMSAVLLLLVTGLAPLVGPRLPLARANERFDLRDLQEPPFDPLAVPSPLVQLKSNLKDDRTDEVVFTISGETPVSRVPVAVHGAYDGVVWIASESLQPGAGEYLATDRLFPAPPEATLSDRSRSLEHRIEMGQQGGHFLPRPGYPEAIDFYGSEPSVRFNRPTGNVALAGGLPPGLSYTVRSAVAPELALSELRSVTVDRQDLSTELGALPPPIRNLASDLVEGKDFGWPQIEAISEQFTLTGFYDAGPQSRPGHSYFRLSEFLSEPERIVGYEEQYAAAAGVIARIAEIPARVVVGYTIDDERWHEANAEMKADVTADDISAWVEVLTNEHGWVVVDVSPDRSREPSNDTSGTTIKNVAVPNPPPPPPPPPDLRPSLQEEEEEPDDEEKEKKDDPVNRRKLLGTVGLATAFSSPLWLSGMSVMGVVMIKRRRHRRRRRVADPSSNVIGAWAELSDRYREAGLRRPRTATVKELALAYASVDRSAAKVEDELVDLAGRVDKASYDPHGPAVADVEAAWVNADIAVRALKAERPWWKRILMRADPRSLWDSPEGKE